MFGFRPPLCSEQKVSLSNYAYCTASAKESRSTNFILLLSVVNMVSLCSILIRRSQLSNNYQSKYAHLPGVIFLLLNALSWETFVCWALQFNHFQRISHVRKSGLSMLCLGLFPVEHWRAILFSSHPLDGMPVELCSLITVVSLTTKIFKNQQTTEYANLL